MNPNGTTQARWRLVEIWGDTADLRHLAGAIAIGIAVSLAGFLLANRLIPAGLPGRANLEVSAMFWVWFGLAALSLLKCGVSLKRSRASWMAAASQNMIKPSIC